MTFSTIIRSLFFRPAFFLLNGITLRYEFSAEWIEAARTAALRALGAQVGAKSYIRKGAFITDAARLQIGARSKIGPFARLFLYENLRIGDDVEIGSGVTVHTAEHIFNDPERALTKQGARYASVSIGSDVYIGSQVTLLSGTVIQNRVIVGAGAVVYGTLESGYIYAGNPARAVKALPVGADVRGGN